MKKRKTIRKHAEEPSLLELLDQVELEMERLRAENVRLKQASVKVETVKKAGGKPPALGKGLAQLFGGPKRG